MSLNDLRVKWLKSTISSLMGIAEPQYVNHLIRSHMLEFQQFFDVEHTGIKDINQIVVFVWRTFYDKLVEEEITVLEEGNICGRFVYYVRFCSAVPVIYGLIALLVYALSSFLFAQKQLKMHLLLRDYKCFAVEFDVLY